MEKSLLALPVLALVSPLFFPWPITLTLAVLGSYVFPPTGLITGVIMDLLYAPTIPHTATAVGLTVTILAFFVRSYVKRNIME